MKLLPEKNSLHIVKEIFKKGDFFIIKKSEIKMPVYIKEENRIQSFSFEEMIERLSTSTHDSEVDPFIVGYIAESRTHFLFTLQEKELRRFGIRPEHADTEDLTDFYTIPAYFAYNEADKHFSTTPSPGRFTQNSHFTIRKSLLLTQSEATELCRFDSQSTGIESTSETESADESDHSLYSPEHAKNENATESIIQLIGTLMGIHTQNETSEKKLIRALINSLDLRHYREDLLQALDDFIDTLSDTNGILHFSIRHQIAYNEINAMYPASENREQIPHILNRLKNAKSLILFHDRLQSINSDNNLSITHEDLVNLLRHLTDNEITQFFSERKETLLTSLSRSEKILFINYLSNTPLNGLLINNTHFFNLLYQDTTFIHDLLTSIDDKKREKLLILSLLPTDIVQGYFEQHFNTITNDIFDLIAKNSFDTLRKLMEKLSDLQICNIIKSKPNYFEKIYDLISISTMQAVFPQIINCLIENNYSIFEFKYFLLKLRSAERNLFFGAFLEKLAGLINTVNDFSCVITTLSQNERNQIISSLNSRFRLTITIPENLLSFLSWITDDQIKQNSALIKESLSHWKTIEDYLLLKKSIMIRTPIKITLLTLLIETRNTQPKHSISFFTNTPTSGTSEMIAFLASLDSLCATYTGQYAIQFKEKMNNLYNQTPMTLDIALREIKIFSGYNDPKRNGRLHHAIKELIHCIEEKKAIDIERICHIASDSCLSLNCCS